MARPTKSKDGLEVTPLPPLPKLKSGAGGRPKKAVALQPPKRKTMTKEVQALIVEKIAEGYKLTEIQKMYPDIIPTRSAVYKCQIDNKEFGEAFAEAYFVHFMGIHEQYRELCNKLASEEYPGVDFREAEAAMKRRQREMEFTLQHMAPVISARFNKTHKVEVTGDVAPQMVVMNYAVEATDPMAKRIHGPVIDQE